MFLGPRRGRAGFRCSTSLVGQVVGQSELTIRPLDQLTTRPTNVIDGGAQVKTRPKRLPLNLRRVVAGCVLGLLLLVLLQASSDAGPPRPYYES